MELSSIRRLDCCELICRPQASGWQHWRFGRTCRPAIMTWTWSFGDMMLIEPTTNSTRTSLCPTTIVSPPCCSNRDCWAQSRLVTIGRDLKFKIWWLVDDTDIYRKKESWTCDVAGDFRNLSPTAMSFSEDGSLLAIAFQDTVSLWDPMPINLKHDFKP